MKKIAYVGIDYHQNFLAIAVMIENSKKFCDFIKLPNINKEIKKYLKKLSKTFEIKACYEASCSGYAFQRTMNSWGYHCDVIAPSLIPKKPGDKRKNDFRDARKLAKNYCNSDLTIVHPPTEQEEAVRGIIRCRISFKDNSKRCKQQINALLMTQGVRWTEKSKWTVKHLNWLRNLELPERYLQQTLMEHLEHLEYLETRIKYLDTEIEKISESENYSQSVIKLKSLRGIDTLSAMLLIAEITDFRRFPNARALMAFLGLIPSEDSSGDKRKDVPITKAGNSRCRKQLVESVQHYVRTPNITYFMKAKLSQVDPYTARTSVKCMERLHKRYWALTMRGKKRQVAITAIAREFVGFIWALMQPEAVTA